MSKQVVLITGALAGIGRATAIAFAHEDAQIVVSGRREEEGRNLRLNCTLLVRRPSLFGQTCVMRMMFAMAPLSRNRSPNAIPGDLAVTYHTQRATAGLLITEATAISHQGQGYADVPGLYPGDAG